LSGSRALLTRKRGPTGTHDPDEAIKADASHGTYGNVLVLNQDEHKNTKDWFAVCYDARSEGAFREGVFRLDLMRSY